MWRTLDQGVNVKQLVGVAEGFEEGFSKIQVPLAWVLTGVGRKMKQHRNASWSQWNQDNWGEEGAKEDNSKADWHVQGADYYDCCKGEPQQDGQGAGYYDCCKGEPQQDPLGYPGTEAAGEEELPEQEEQAIEEQPEHEEQADEELPDQKEQAAEELPEQEEQALEELPEQKEQAPDADVPAWAVETKLPTLPKLPLKMTVEKLEKVVLPKVILPAKADGPPQLPQAKAKPVPMVTFARRQPPTMMLATAKADSLAATLHSDTTVSKAGLRKSCR